MPRKRVLSLMLAIFVGGYLLSWLSSGYGWLMLARLVAALAHGSLFGVGVVVATSLAPECRRASAIALMFSGLTIANIVGVPLGTLVGRQYGWRAMFAAITGLGVVSLLFVAFLIPGVAGGGAIDLAAEFRAARQPRVLLALVTTVLGWACVFAQFTYIVAILKQRSGLSPHDVTVIPFAIGVGLTLGINLGGKPADRGLMHALVGLAPALALLSTLFAAASASEIAAVVVILHWGMAAFATVSPLQTRVLDTASEAPNVASALDDAAFNLGNAAGAFLTGAALDLGFGLTAPPVAPAIAGLQGLAAAICGMRLDKRRAPI